MLYTLTPYYVYHMVDGKQCFLGYVYAETGTEANVKAIKSWKKLGDVTLYLYPVELRDIKETT